VLANQASSWFQESEENVFLRRIDVRNDMIGQGGTRHWEPLTAAANAHGVALQEPADATGWCCRHRTVVNRDRGAVNKMAVRKDHAAPKSRPLSVRSSVGGASDHAAPNLAPVREICVLFPHVNPG
jgi:hypothetical protein